MRLPINIFATMVLSMATTTTTTEGGSNHVLIFYRMIYKMFLKKAQYPLNLKLTDKIGAYPVFSSHVPAVSNFNF